MVQTLTAGQIAALAQDSARVVTAVKIDLDTDLLYCSGFDQVTLAAVDYTPRGLNVSAINITDPARARATVDLDDLDGTIAAVWYTERFSGQTVTITEAIWYDGAWVVTRTIPWICETCQRSSDGRFVLNLSGAGGMRPRAGLEIGSRADWHLAPERGTSVQIGDMAATVT
jgi:hypothetical protein